MAWSMGSTFAGRAAGLEFRREQLLRARGDDLLGILDSAQDRDSLRTDVATQGDDLAREGVFLPQHKHPGAALVVDDRVAWDGEHLCRFTGTGNRRPQGRASGQGVVSKQDEDAGTLYLRIRDRRGADDFG